MLSLYCNSKTIYTKFQLPFLSKGTIRSNTYLAFIFQNSCLRTKTCKKSPKFYVYWELLVTSQVLKAIVSNWCGTTSISYVGMSLQNLFFPSVHADRVSTRTRSWLLHSKLCRSCSGACVSVYTLQKNNESSHKLLKTAQPNLTLPGWKRSISLDHAV